MNERIKELKKQAWEYAMAVHDGHIVPPPDNEVWPMDKVFDEKFAELIVRECAEQIKTQGISASSEGYGDYEIGFNAGLFHALYTTKQHFGVEE